MKILVIGCGSIGERHIRNLKNIGLDDISVFDPNTERLKYIEQRYHTKSFDTLPHALGIGPEVSFICTPPNSHVTIALAAARTNSHLFIEKPLSHNLEATDLLEYEIKSRNLKAMIGYNLRFYQGLHRVKDLLEKDSIGKTLWVRAEVGQYLPDWRPWQDYRKSYTAKENMGGGIILDASHEIDLLYWLFGDIRKVFCGADKLTKLEIDVEDTAEILLWFKNGISGNCHLDMIQRGYSRTLKVVGEEGTIILDIGNNTLRIYSSQNNRWGEEIITENRNEMYLKGIKHFIECIENDSEPFVGLKDAKRVLEIVLACKKSNINGKVIEI